MTQHNTTVQYEGNIYNVGYDIGYEGSGNKSYVFKVDLPGEFINNKYCKSFTFSARPFGKNRDGKQCYMWGGDPVIFKRDKLIWAIFQTIFWDAVKCKLIK